jgi:hypothetical protein
MGLEAGLTSAFNAGRLRVIDTEQPRVVCIEKVTPVYLRWSKLQQPKLQ